MTPISTPNNPVEGSPRQVALAACFDILTSYMLDNCPDDSPWEDFDPEIDQLRVQLADPRSPCLNFLGSSSRHKITPEVFNNDDRADLVADHLQSFAKATGLDPAFDGDGPQTVAGDMICNILHWVARQDPDGRAAALMAVRCGIAHYMTESFIDYTASGWIDELGPEAFIEIHASCNGEVWHSQTGECIASLVSRYPL